jgi:hypothetical protein
VSDFYTDVEQAVLEKLQAAPGLAVVRTWEADIRDVLFSGEKLSKGFSTEEIPAVNVSAMQGAVTASPHTTLETQYTIPVTVVVVAKGQTKKAARAAARELQAEVEQVMNAARSSAGQFLPNTWVKGDLTLDIAIVADQPYHFAIAEVGASLWRVAQ